MFSPSQMKSLPGVRQSASDEKLNQSILDLTHQICRADIIHCIIALDCGLDFNFISLLAIISCHWRGLSPVQYGKVP